MISDELSLGGLFVSSFLAATLLPGGSEAVLFGVLKLNPGLFWPALALATLGNTLGGMSSYLLGRFLPNGHDEPPPQTMKQRFAMTVSLTPNSLPERERDEVSLREFRVKSKPTRGLGWVRRYGSPALLLAWAPLIGDALCVAAGWLRLNAAQVALFMAAGKLARYLAIAWMTI